MKYIANGRATYAGTFQGNGNQVNGGHPLQKCIQNPHHTFKRKRSSKQ